VDTKTGLKPFDEIDEIRLSFNHIRIWFTAGMGFFTDAYDLFIIGAVLDVFGKFQIAGFDPATRIFGMPASGFIGASAIFAAVLGQLVFGLVADRIGRKTVYGVEASILTAGALLSALSPNLYWLIGFRFLQGIGIGGDYPISATIMSEYSNRKDRGKLVALVFANQGIGSVVAVLVGLASVVALPPDLAWRVMLAIGAIPAASVIYLRRKIPETPRYSLFSKGDKAETARSAETLGVSMKVKEYSARKYGFPEFLRRYGLTLFVTSASWFLLDMAFYGTGVFSGAIVSSILPVSSSVPLQQQISALILEAGLPFFVGLFGYFTAVALMDRLGRKPIQLQGFIGMAVFYALVAAVMKTAGTKVTGFVVPTELALVFYVLTFFFIDFGANTTTFVVPTEVFPTSYRTTGHGISAASGKLGAAITTFLFPTLLVTMGVRNIMVLLAVVSVIGALVTIPLREPKLATLESSAREELEAKN
jgi:PHS family inorganic phosphate transporter-like MFS transporter